MSALSRIADALAPWQSIYADSTGLSNAITATHVVALLVGGGMAIGFDRMTLRVLRRSADERALHLREQAAVHRPVMIAIVALVVSGLLMLTADLTEFIASPVYWLKMTLVVFLLTNGLLMMRAESRIERSTGYATADAHWHRLGVHARVSMALWIAIATLGVAL